MAKHSQKPTPLDQGTWVCKRCAFGNCNVCIDVSRLGTLKLDVATCNCKSPRHGERLKEGIDRVNVQLGRTAD